MSKSTPRRQRITYTLVFTRNPDPYWQRSYTAWVREEAEKRGLYFPSPAEISEVLEARAKAAATD